MSTSAPDIGKLYVDLTTAAQEVGRIAHGTTRIERGVVAALARLQMPEVHFCRYDRSRGEFAAVTAHDALQIATAETITQDRRNSAPAWRRHPLLDTGRQLEKWVRQNIREPWRARRRRIATAIRPNHFPLFGPGSMLLVPGELQRHDFAVLMELKRRLPLRLAFFFYDLLGVLPLGDPRLSDPASSDLPSSDFLLREADLVLSISAHSAGIFLRHATTRGVAAPSVQVVRLGHFVRSAPGGAAPDLTPGQFVLTVGDVVPRKNHALLVEVWRRLLKECPQGAMPLVVAGRVGRGGAELVRAIAADPELARGIRILSNVDDNALGWLYTHCLFTVFPSRSEGYGLPVSESLAAGKVCIASWSEAVPEASQGLGIHLDPDDLGAWTSHIQRLMTDSAALRVEEQRIAGFRPSTWDDTAADILGILDRRRGYQGAECSVQSKI